MIPPRYLVQTRDTGEVWRTRWRAAALSEAESTAADLAARVIAYPNDLRFPQHGYIRVVYRGAVVREWTPGRAV